MPVLDIDALLGPEPERPPNSTDPAYKTYPQEKKKAWREYITNKQQLKNEAWSMGYEPEDLGITGDKEQGQSYKRWLESYGMLDRNYEYKNGMKRNTATSDMDAQARNEWVPMTDRDKEEYARHQQDGGNWRNVIARIQSDARGKMDNWAAHNEARGGGIRKDASGNLYDVGDDGQNIYYDAYGARIDPRNGQRTGDIYGSSRMTYGNQIGQNMAGQQSTGVTGPRAAAPNPSAGQPNVANQPGYTYQPNANPWLGGGGQDGAAQRYRQKPAAGYYGQSSSSPFGSY